MGFRADTVAAARAALADQCAAPRPAAKMPTPRRWRTGRPGIRQAPSRSGITSCGDHPHDILAFRLAHFVNFWFGRPEAMLASVLSVEPHWSRALPGYVSHARLPLLRA